MTRKRIGIYGRAIQAIPFLCGGGWLVAVAGFAAKIDWLAKAGVALFMSGFAVWGLANGGALVWAMKEGIRKDGIQVFTHSPWSSALFILLMLFFLSFGIWVVWFVTARL